MPTKRLQAARLQVVDALRGAALLGILVVHCNRWFTADALPKQLYDFHAAGPLNALVIGKVELLFVDKFYTLFSFLFGLSFALMISRSHEAPAVFYRRFLRRLCILGAIGLLHYLHWRGDILLIYAALGVLLLLFNRVSNRVVLLFGLLLALNLPVNLVRIYHGWAAPPTQSERQHRLALLARNAVTNYRTLVHGSYSDNFLANAHSFGNALNFQFGSGRIYQTLGAFLIGLYAGRRRIFQYATEKQALFRRFAFFAVLVLVGTKALALLLTRTYGPELQASDAVRAIFRTVYDLRNVATTAFYIAGLTLLFQYWPGRWAVAPLSLVGRMALTNYLLQTLVGSLLFFGYGLGLQGTSQLWVASLLSLPIFMLQVGLSAYWLQHFSYGPVEWAWRSLTLGKMQPMRVRPVLS
ncbi:DUF418 domain-containing protein [Hymenobacter nivis]|uniref:DUF418 domain-containing protein n=1 Tax=Hymenobacter nivis TaxID=1850093 RepID=UPI001FE33B44|nr:DUF418 domain-containing protein [Hymenobacter nivis]